jgi:hypothetical protein
LFGFYVTHSAARSWLGLSRLHQRGWQSDGQPVPRAAFVAGVAVRRAPSNCPTRNYCLAKSTIAYTR